MSNQRYSDTFTYAFDEDGLGGFNSATDLNAIVGKVIKPIAPNMQENFQDIPARYGGIYLGTDYQEKEIDIPITVECEDSKDFDVKVQNLSAILINSSKDKDVQYPIRFNNNEDVVYYGHFTSIPQPQFLNDNVWDFQLTLVFMLADPRGFLPQEQIKITSNNQTIIPKGNTEVKPIIHILPNKDLYYFGYTQDEHYVASGYNVNAGNQLIDENGQAVDMNEHQTVQVDDPCNSLATWFQAGSDTQSINVYKGEIDGKAVSIPTSITVGKDKNGRLYYGNASKHVYNQNGIKYQRWYGPVLLHNGLPKVSPFWSVKVRLHHVKTDKRNRAMGRVEAYLLDNNGNVKGRMGIQDLSHGRYPVAYIQLGSSFDPNNDKGNYKTLVWTQGPVNQQHDEGKKDYRVKYTKVVKVKVRSKKTRTRSTDDVELDEDSFRGLETRKRRYTHHKTSRRKRSDKGNSHKYRKRKVSVTRRKRGGKRYKVSKPKVKSVKKSYHKYESSLSQTDAFSNFFGDFYLERSRADNGQDKWSASITRMSLDSVTPVTDPSQAVDIKTSYIDQDGKFGFSLANVAVAFQKMAITEDLVNPPQNYKQDFLTLTNLVIKRTDGSTDPDDIPHPIVRAGQEVIIDCTDEQVYVEGQSANRYVSWGSDFPAITGGVPQSLHFTPSVENADIYIDYVPAIK